MQLGLFFRNGGFSEVSKTRKTGLMVSLVILATSGCNEPEMKPLQNLSAYCQAFGVADNQIELQQDHQAQIEAIQSDLKTKKVAKEFQKLLQLAAPLTSIEIHNAVRTYAEIHKIRFSCSKIELQTQRKNQERKARIAAAKEANEEPEGMAKAKLDPSYVPPEAPEQIRAKLNAFLQKLKNAS